MKHRYIRILSALLAVLICAGGFCLITPAASAAEGTCGGSAVWSLANGVLTVSGTGAMEDYSEYVAAPWQPYAGSIQRVVVADGVTHVGSMAFYHLPALTTVTLADSVTSLGELAFAGCSLLAQITMNGLQTIGRGAFHSCVALANIILPQSLLSIDDDAFFYCRTLAGITVPAGVQSLGARIFAYCSSLVYVNILAPVTQIPYWSFYGCDRLTDLTLPSTVDAIGTDAFSECPELGYVEYGGSDQVRQTIADQLAGVVTREQDSTTFQDVSFSQTGGASIATTNTTQYDENASITTGAHVNATVTDSTGWSDVAQSVADTMNTGEFPAVDVQLQGDAVVPQGSLDILADRDVTIWVHTSHNVDWQVIMGDQTVETLSGEQDFSMQLTPYTGGKFGDILGNAECYSVMLGGTTLNTTILFPLGPDAARRTATLYRIDRRELVKLSSVIVDDDGKAAFSLAGTQAGEYILALDIPTIDWQEVVIPEKLAAQYDVTYGATLTDAYGNQYVLTGRVNKLGFGAGTLGLIVLGVLLGSVLLVGTVMVVWNKMRRQRYTPPPR